MDPVHCVLVFPDRQSLRVLFKPCCVLSPDLAELLHSDVVETFGQW
jgi:hypothetical protein